MQGIRCRASSLSLAREIQVHLFLHRGRRRRTGGALSRQTGAGRHFTASRQTSDVTYCHPRGSVSGLAVAVAVACHAIPSHDPSAVSSLEDGTDPAGVDLHLWETCAGEGTTLLGQPYLCLYSPFSPDNSAHPDMRSALPVEIG